MSTTTQLQKAVTNGRENIIEWHKDIHINYTMDSNDNYLPSKYRPFLTKIIHNNFYCAIIIILEMFQILINNGFMTVPELFVIEAFIFFPWVILWILSVNRKSFWSIIKTFEFWFKIYYTLISVFCELAHNEIDKPLKTFKSPWEPIMDGIDFIKQLLVILCICFFDGISANIKFKAIITCIAAISYFTWSIYYQFFYFDQHIIIINKNVQISLVSQLASSWRILGIFFAKQSFWNIVAIYRKLNKATVINFKPYLVYDNNNGDDVSLSSNTTGLNAEKNLSAIQRDNDNKKDDVIEISMDNVTKMTGNKMGEDEESLSDDDIECNNSDEEP